MTFVGQRIKGNVLQSMYDRWIVKSSHLLVIALEFIGRRSRCSPADKRPLQRYSIIFYRNKIGVAGTSRFRLGGVKNSVLFKFRMKCKTAKSSSFARSVNKFFQMLPQVEVKRSFSGG